MAYPVFKFPIIGMPSKSNSLIAEPHPTSAPCVLSIEYTDRPLYYMMDSTIFVMIFIMDEWEKSSYWYFYRFMINS